MHRIVNDQHHFWCCWLSIAFLYYKPLIVAKSYMYSSFGLNHLKTCHVSGIYTFLNWYGQCHCGPKAVTVHIMWACGLCLSLSPLWIFSLFSVITKNSSLSLFHSVCLTLITFSWQVLAHWVVDGPMSASSSWISFEILTHKPHLPPRSPALSLSLCLECSLAFFLL